MNKFQVIEAELDRLHNMTRTVIQGDVTYAEVFERIVALQQQLLKELPPSNKFEIFCREWAKGCTASENSKEGYPWECAECSNAFLQAVYKIANE